MSDPRIGLARAAAFEEAATEFERGWLALGRRLGRLEMVRKIESRIRRRLELGLPAVECASSPPVDSCRCLERALDEAGAEGKAAVLKVASGLHREPTPPSPEPVEEEAQPAALEPEPVTTPVAAGPRPDSAPLDRVISPKEPRIVKHFPRWYDEPPGIFNKKF